MFHIFDKHLKNSMIFYKQLKTSSFYDVNVKNAYKRPSISRQFEKRLRNINRFELSFKNAYEQHIFSEEFEKKDHLNNPFNLTRYSNFFK